MGLTAVISRATSIYGYREPSYEAITVKRGDTLWSIAENYNKRGISENTYMILWF